MRFLMTFAVALFLFASNHFAQDKPSPEMVVRRALTVAGIKDFSEPMAMRCYYGASTSDGNDVIDLRVSGDTLGKHATFFALQDSELASGMIAEGEKSWQVEGGRRRAPGKKEQTMWAEIRHGERAQWLLPLLQDKQFKLTHLGESQWNGSAVIGINVKYPKRKDVKLYFDKLGGHLRKCEMSWTDAKIVQEHHDARLVDPYESDVRELLDAGIAPYGDQPIRHLRQTLEKIPARAEREKLIEQLGARSFAVRKEATRKIEAMGPSVALWLTAATKHKDGEIAKRALHLLSGRNGPRMRRELRALVNVISAGALDGSAQVLLDYLPFAAGSSERREVIDALKGLAQRDGRPHPALLKALKGPEPQRSAAALALGRREDKLKDDAVRRLKIPLVKSHRIVMTLNQSGNATVVTLRLREVALYNRFDPKWIEEAMTAGQKKRKR